MRHIVGLRKKCVKYGSMPINPLPLRCDTGAFSIVLMISDATKCENTLRCIIRNGNQCNYTC